MSQGFPGGFQGGGFPAVQRLSALAGGNQYGGGAAGMAQGAMPAMPHMAPQTPMASFMAPHGAMGDPFGVNRGGQVPTFSGMTQQPTFIPRQPFMMAPHGQPAPSSLPTFSSLAQQPFIPPRTAPTMMAQPLQSLGVGAPASQRQLFDPLAAARNAPVSYPNAPPVVSAPPPPPQGMGQSTMTLQRPQGPAAALSDRRAKRVLSLREILGV